MVFGLMSSPVFAANYAVDYLESGNPGGWTASSKSFDDAMGVSVGVGDTFDVDVWLRDCPTSPAATSGGFWIYFQGSTALLRITSILRYNSQAGELPGPWAGGGVVNIGPLGSIPDGAAMAVTINIAGASPDDTGDIIIARVTLTCLAAGEADVQVKTIPGFSTWSPKPPWHDAEIEPSSFTIICEGGDGDACERDADCDDGLFCNGEETCVDETCKSGTDPCPGKTCNEGTNSCEAVPTATTTIKTGSEMPDISDNSMPTIPDKAAPTSPGSTEPTTSIAITRPHTPDITTNTKPDTGRTKSPASITKLSSKTATSLPIAIPSQSSPYKVVISPLSVTLAPGGMVQLSAKTISGEGEVEGTYLWKIVPASPIRSTIDKNGLFTAGNNISGSIIKETVFVTDPLHDNNDAIAIITIEAAKQPTVECELSISPSSATLLPGDTITFSAKNFGEKCAECSYAWKINSKIGSQINANGLYTAGSNVSDEAVIDIIMINDTINKTRTDAIVTVQSGEKAAKQKPQQKSLSGRGPYSTALIALALVILFLIAVLLFRKIKR